MKIPRLPQLVALTEGIDIPLGKPIVLIGRHQECDVQIPSRKISRRHCCVAMVDDHVVVRDLGSTNGIRINGIKVVAGNLQENDELTIGNLRYQLQWLTESEQTLPTPRQAGKARKPPAQKPVRAEESLDIPTPLSDEGMLHPALQSEPKAPTLPGPSDPTVRSTEVPDSVEFEPLEPPRK